MICFILVALFVLFFVWGGAFIEGRHSFENTYFKGALIRGGRSLQNIYFKGGAHSRGGALSRKYGMITFYYDISSANFRKTPLRFKPNISRQLVLLAAASEVGVI